MPFTPVDSLPPNPDVRIFFSGLMILEPREDNTCEVFVHSSAPRHYFTIEVRRKQAGRPDELMMRHVGPLAYLGRDGDIVPPIHGMQIVKLTPGAKGVRSFIPTTPPIDGDPQSLDLAIDFESAGFHNGNPQSGTDPTTNQTFRLLDIDSLGGRPSILLDDGTFYTAALTRSDIEIRLRHPDGSDRVLAPFASLIGAAISLDDDSSLVIFWRQFGKLERLELERTEGTSYEIYIVNDPLFESDSITNPERDPKHDEFREYYKILHRVPTDRQFRLNVTIPPGELSRGSTRTPCMSIIKGGR
ncbi:MAG TPA: hypothetical protein VN844_13245 [Pyrinomonadaceae bacterium]|nr:hypothetical protein [Pyrinomonadaceae bacterium]